MGSTINPLFASLYAGNLVPGGMNPTGNQLSLGGTSTTSTGSNTLLPSTPISTTSSGTTNPYGAVPGSLPFPANAGSGYSSTTSFGGTAGGAGAGGGTYLLPGGGKASLPGGPFGFLGGMNAQNQYKLAQGLNKVYGQGLGELIYNFLMSGAGFNQQTIDNLLASLGPGIERGEENIMEQFSATGNRFGSPAATGLGDFLSQVNLNEGQIVAQMYGDALNRFLDVMMGSGGTTAGIRAGSPSGLDKLLSGLGLAGQAGQTASQVISAINPNADTGILDAIAVGLAL